MNRISKEPVYIQSIVMAGIVMTETAKKISDRFDSFGTWLLAGYGAGITLLFEKHEEFNAISAATVKFVATLFLISVVIVVVEKYLAIWVGACAEVAALTMKEVNEHFKKQREEKIPLSFDLTAFKEKLLLGILPSHRWIVARSIKKISTDDDHSQAGRKLMWIAQFQGFLVLAEVVLFLRSIGELI